ncbi:cell division protein FtsL [Natribacillus halophilus]|uniref:Cell division protein FtsL n=1 Tax=Natribacillus halophilus TaxID=549003 RepID=A0A1G8ME87_9BACI|nr:cell division protein FtsL [Natribacillus halophilus]SDI66288.1 cell division protein FtsL [Natribacillus halophilus]
MRNLAEKPYVREEQREVQTVRRQIRKTFTRAEKGLLTLIGAAIVFSAILMVSNYASMYTQNQEISQLQNDISQQQQYNEGLEHQVSELSDPERILNIAEENGMELNEDNVRVLQP